MYTGGQRKNVRELAAGRDRKVDNSPVEVELPERAFWAGNNESESEKREKNSRPLRRADRFHRIRPTVRWVHHNHLQCHFGRRGKCLSQRESRAFPRLIRFRSGRRWVAARPSSTSQRITQGLYFSRSSPFSTCSPERSSSSS